MRSRLLFYGLVFAVFSTTVLGAQQSGRPSSPLVTQSINDAQRTTLRGNIHPLARVEFDRGEAPADLPLDRMLMVLKRSPQQEAALGQLIQDQQNVQSSEYHRWLTPEQFGERFGPGASDVQAVTQWLASKGLRVSQISKSGLFIEFSGNASQVTQAFGTSVHTFVVNGQQHWANVSDPTIPAALAPVVAGIDSLHNFEKQAQHVSLGAYSASSHRLVSPKPTFTINNSPAEYAVSPYDFAAIYDLFPLWNATPTPINGTGQTIAIVGRSDVNPGDAKAMWNYFGLDGTHTPEPTLVVTYNGPNPGKTGDEAEADIDTQWSGAVAPGATVNLVVSASTSSTDGVDLSALYIVDNNLATIMSESYGACEKSMGSTGVQFYGSLWQQAAAQGISVFVSSGDSGAAGCDDPGGPANSGLQVNGIASTPYNAAVGGTDFNQFNKWSTYWNLSNDSVTKQSAIGYIPETTWNDSCTNQVLLSVGGSVDPEANCNNTTFASLLDSTGGGGGQSSSWLKPAWQTGTPSDNARDLPDVVLFSGNGFLNSYYLVCQSDAVYFAGCGYGALSGFGGTSISSPQFAGIMALINQKTGSSQGIPGLTLYKLAAQQPSAFHDIPAGSTIAVPCVTSTPNCTTTRTGDAYGVLSGYSTAAGYDLATGLGSVDVANLVNKWQSVSFIPSTTTLAVNGGSPVSITHGATVPFSVTVSPSAATGEIALMVVPGTPGYPGIAGFALNAGSVNSSTALLPGGSYNLIVHYGGDSTYGGSYSNSVPVVISSEPSKILVNLVTTDARGVATSYSASNATYGSGYAYLRIDAGDANASVSPSSGISSLCSTRRESCPTGKITLTAPGSSLNGVVLLLNSEGYAQTAVPSAGSYSITAAYPGDAGFAASAGTASFTMAKATTTATTTTEQANQIQYGQPLTLYTDVTTSSLGIAPGGTVQFSIDGNPVSASPFITASSGYQLTKGVPQYAYANFDGDAPGYGLGGHTLSAAYSGDRNYAASVSSPVTFTVLKGNAPVFLGTGNGAVVGQTATITLQILETPYGMVPTGTVAFYDGGVLIPGTVTYSLQPSGQTLVASISTSFSTTGDHPLSASYSGDANYAPESARSDLFVLGPVSIQQQPGYVTIASPGQSGSNTLTITSNGGFTGAVSLACTVDPKASESTCSFTSGTNSGSTLQVNVGTGATTVTFNVGTTASHTIAKVDSAPLGTAATVAMAGVLALFLPVRKRYRTLRVCLIVIAITLGLGACGGGSGGSGGGTSGSGGGSSHIDPGTPLGIYTFGITATTGSGASQVILSMPESVTVN